VKALLLDQRVVAGLGNIYVCEALYLARIAPTRAAGTISRARLAKLVEAVREVLTAAIRAGGSTLRDYARPDGELGYFAKEWRVYGREGEPCECGGWSSGESIRGDRPSGAQGARNDGPEMIDPNRLRR
jgi:formamidopyrimidine-DNA glycosylase